MKTSIQLLLFILLIIFFVPKLEGQSNLDSGLVAFYPFNINANDSSGNGIHGIVYGAMLIEDRCGNPNSAYWFDGSSYIDLGDNFNSVNVPYSISVWVNPTGSDHYNPIFSSDDPNNGYYYYGFRLQESYLSVSSDWGSGGPNWPSFRRSGHTSQAQLIKDEWNHVAAIVRSSTDMSIYINGEEKSFVLLWYWSRDGSQSLSSLNRAI